MARRSGRPYLVALGVVAVVAVLVAVVAVVHRSEATGPATLRVMTRNLYLGGDITRPVRAAQGATGAGGDASAALLALGHSADELRTVVDRTDFPTRARLLAAEMARTTPDLVALQEVTLWRHGPLQLDPPGRAAATTVDLDFLPVLRDQLAAAGHPYEVVSAQQEADVEAPAFSGDPRTSPDTRDVRLTVSDVVLARTGSGVSVTGSGSGQYRHRLDLDLGGLPFSFVRGYAFVDVSVGGHPVRFVASQLESQSPDVAVAQAQELLDGPVAAARTPVVVACDCNSDPDDAAVGAGGSVPESAAYALLTRSGLVDSWRAQPDAGGTGLTCCLGEELDSPTATYRHRVDLVLLRGTADTPLAAVQDSRTGADPADRDPATGRWPSDHAGLVASLRIG